MAIGKSRGHLVYYDADAGVWKYQDTGLEYSESRPCKKCGKIVGDDGIDPCLASLIAALNAAGLKTTSSCCGHGYRPGRVTLVDGREIIHENTGRG